LVLYKNSKGIPEVDSSLDELVLSKPTAFWISSSSNAEESSRYSLMGTTE